MNHTRARYQQGSLTTERRKNKTVVWVYRWRETHLTGQITRCKLVVGTKSQFPSKAAALKAVDGLRLDINMEAVVANADPLTIDELIEHYRRTELTEADAKTARTKQVYGHQLSNVISPRWGTLRLKDVKPVAVESWLNAMPVAPGTKADDECICQGGHGRQAQRTGRHCSIVRGKGQEISGVIGPKHDGPFWTLALAYWTFLGVLNDWK